MLTLTRAVGERIYIGDDIVIEVRAILDSRQVRISIEAPRQVPIHRAEIFEAVSRQNRSAALAGDAASFTKMIDGVAGARPGGEPGSQVGVDPAAPGGSPSPPI